MAQTIVVATRLRPEVYEAMTSLIRPGEKMTDVLRRAADEMIARHPEQPKDKP